MNWYMLTFPWLSMGELGRGGRKDCQVVYLTFAEGISMGVRQRFAALISTWERT